MNDTVVIYDRIRENLNKYNSKMSTISKKEIILEMWSNYGKTFIEYIFLDKFRKNSKHIKIINKNILEEILKKNKPVIFISGHFANFELMSMEITKQKIKLATIYRPLNNYFLNLKKNTAKANTYKEQILKKYPELKKPINHH